MNHLKMNAASPTKTNEMITPPSKYLGLGKEGLLFSSAFGNSHLFQTSPTLTVPFDVASGYKHL